MDLKMKTVLLTGGATGIGFEYAKELLRSGVARMAILDSAVVTGAESVNKLNAEFGGGRVIFISCDVTKKSEFEAAFAETVKELGGLDIMINNAGILNERNWESMMSVNLIAATRGTIMALQYMGKDKGGKGGVIVNTSSTAGIYPSWWFPTYCATKHGVVGLSRSFGLPYYYERTGVRVLTICPSFTYTKLLAEASDNVGLFVDKETAMETLKKQSTQNPENVAKALVDIISRGNSGSVWVSEAGEPVKEVFIHDNFTLVSSPRKES